MNSLETTVCPECGQVLHNSGYAVCPECGYPLALAPDQETQVLAQAEAKARRTGRILTLSLLLGLAAIVVVISMSSDPPKGPDTGSESVSDSGSETSHALFNQGPEASKTDQIFSVKGNMRTLQVMLETYAADWQGRYPESLEQLKAEATQPKLIYWKDFSNPVTAARGIGSLGAMAEASAYTSRSELRGFVLYEAQPGDGNCISGYRITGTDPEGLLITQEPDDTPYTLVQEARVKEAKAASPCKPADAPVLIGDAKPASPSPSPSGSESASPTDPAPASALASAPGASSPSADAQVAIEASDIESTLRSWQALKREAFLAEDESRLEEVLSGQALSEVRGGLQWWISQDAMYKDIQLHELKILNQNDVSETQAEAEVSISETKDNTVQGRNTSTYKAKYTLEKRDGRWFITGIQAE